jgi:hypothetical protein
VDRVLGAADPDYPRAEEAPVTEGTTWKPVIAAACPRPAAEEIHIKFGQANTEGVEELVPL